MKRPTILTLLCVAGFIMSLLSFVQVFSPSVKKMGDWIPAVYGLIISALFVSYIGIWHFKRWGGELFSLGLMAQVLFLIFKQGFTLGAWIEISLQTATLVVVLFFYKKMDGNL